MDNVFNFEQQFIELIAREVSNKKDKKLIFSALELAKKAHEGQKRRSGEPFIIHPILVGIEIWNRFKEPEFTAAALLHDTVEDNEDLEAEEIYKKFGKKIGFIVDAMNKREKGFYGKKIKFSDKTERLIWASLKDIRVLILKLSDRTQNLETLCQLQPNKQVRMAFETQAIYYPLKKICLEGKSIKEIEKNFKKFLVSKKIKTAKEIKEYLYGIFFKDFSKDLYSLVYENSDKIVWEVEDFSWLEKLVKISEFNKCTDIKTMRSEQGGYFSATFVFKHGCIINSRGKLRVASVRG